MGYSSGPNMPQPQQHQNGSFNLAMGGPVGPAAQGYNGGIGDGASQYGGVVASGPGDFGGGLGNAGGYRVPPSTMGMQSTGGYPDNGSYGLQSGFQQQPNRPGTGPGPRLPAYQGMPPSYY